MRSRIIYKVVIGNAVTNSLLDSIDIPASSSTLIYIGYTFDSQTPHREQIPFANSNTGPKQNHIIYIIIYSPGPPQD